MNLNKLYISSLLKERFPETYNDLKSKLPKEVELCELDGTLDIWARDYMPVQINDNTFVHYTYWPDYLLQYKKYQSRITNPTRLEQKILLQHSKKLTYIPLILDGGNLVLTHKHIIMTEKIYKENCLSDNEEENIEFINQMIEQAFDKIPLIVKWHKAEYLGHTDWIVNYIGGQDHLLIIGRNEKKTDDVAIQLIGYITTCYSKDYKIKEFKLKNPDEETSWAYLNYVQIGKYIFIPKVNNEKNDREAQEFIKETYSEAGQDVTVIPIDCERIVKDSIEGGGALHCLTWNPIL